MNSTINRSLQLHRQDSNQQQQLQLQHQKRLLPHQQGPLKRGLTYYQQNALGGGGGVGVNVQQKPGHYRKTSAEIVSEAKTMLAGGNNGGARLVSTRRPITPREPRRQLYGKLAPPGRPPSAFSLRYLQFESRALPCLEPIQQQQQQHQQQKQQRPQNIALEEIPTVPRSGSVGTLLDNVGNTISSSSGNTRLQGKLPALLSPPKITASLDNFGFLCA